MKSIGIDKLYYQLDKHILLAQSYTEINELFFIIKACRLKPYSLFFEDKTTKLVLHRWWFDEFGNSFKITNKKIKIVYNDLELDRDKIICTDLYSGLSLDKITKISKLAYLSLGKDDESYNICAIVTFLGIDNYLRSYAYQSGEWKIVSPLTLGFSHLKTIAQNKDTRYFKEFAIKENAGMPCVSPVQWLTYIPPNKVLLALLDREYEGLFSFLKT